MAIDDPHMGQADELIDDVSDDDISGAIHVSYRAVDNVVEEKRYRLFFRDYKFKRSSLKHTLAAGLQFAFDKERHPEYENRKLFHDLWITDGTMHNLKNFLTAAGINPEMFREEEAFDPATGAVIMAADGRPATKCVYTVKDQIDSVLGAPVYADVVTEEYEGTAADGVTKEKRKKSVVGKFIKQ